MGTTSSFAPRPTRDSGTGGINVSGSRKRSNLCLREYRGCWRHHVPFRRENRMSRCLRRFVVVGLLLIGLRPVAAQTDAKVDEKSAAQVESKTQKWEFGVSVRAVGGPCVGLFS